MSLPGVTVYHRISRKKCKPAPADSWVLQEDSLPFLFLKQRTLSHRCIMKTDTLKIVYYSAQSLMGDTRVPQKHQSK